MKYTKEDIEFVIGFITTQLVISELNNGKQSAITDAYQKTLAILKSLLVEDN